MSHNAVKPISIKNICKSFEKKQVLKDVSFDVPPGQIIGLIGLNGAGKTTLIKIILGLLSQDSGGISIFDNQDITPQTRKNLSFLPEKFQPSIYLKGREFLKLTLSYYGKEYDDEKARYYVEAMGLEYAALDLKMTKYSKGMGQKIGLASAFLTGAPLLILDEPMSGLDPRARIQLKKVLGEYVAAGNTIFFSSHILSDIDEICHNIAVIHQSKLIFSGAPSGFKEKYGDEHLERAFLKAIE